MRRLCILPVAILLSCDRGPTCEEACQKAFNCLVEWGKAAGHCTQKAEDLLGHMVQVCSRSCGGTWENPGEAGICFINSTCREIAVGACPPFAGWEGLDGLLLRSEPTCAALAGETERCNEIEWEERRIDCLLAAALKDAVRQRSQSRCDDLPEVQQRFCRTVVEGSPESCPHLSSPYDEVCTDFLTTRRSDEAVMLSAAIAGDASVCQGIQATAKRESCIALVHQDPDLCPTELLVDAGMASAVGRTLAPSRGASGSSPDERGGGVPLLGLERLLFAVASISASALWLLTPVWLFGVFRQIGRSRRNLFLLGGVLVGFVLVRLAAVTEAPLNFVEYERLFVPWEGDIARLTYSGMAMLFQPIFMLSKYSFPVAFTGNAVVAALGVVVTFATVLDLTGAWWAALWSSVLLAFSPVWLRISGTAGETLGFSVLSLVLLFESYRLRGSRLAPAMVLVTTVLVCTARPEGVLVAPLAVAAGLTLRGGTDPRTKIVGTPARWVVLPVVGTAWALFAIVAATLPVPQIAWGLFAENLLELLGELLTPRFSTMLLAPTAAAGVWLGLKRKRGFVLMTAWVVGLTLAWGVQGAEGNRVFGSSRYAVMAIPPVVVLAACAVDTLAGTTSKWVRGALILTLPLSYLPGAQLVWAEGNVQKEYRFLKDAAAAIPDGVLLVVASNQTGEAFSPHAGILALLAMDGKKPKWKPVDEFLSESREIPAEDNVLLLADFHMSQGEIDAVGRQFRLTPIVQHFVMAVPDLPFYPAVGPTRLTLYSLAAL